MIKRKILIFHINQPMNAKSKDQIYMLNHVKTAGENASYINNEM